MKTLDGGGAGAGDLGESCGCAAATATATAAGAVSGYHGGITRTRPDGLREGRVLLDWGLDWDLSSSGPARPRRGSRSPTDHLSELRNRRARNPSLANAHRHNLIGQDRGRQDKDQQSELLLHRIIVLANKLGRRLKIGVDMSSPAGLIELKIDILGLIFGQKVNPILLGLSLGITITGLTGAQERTVTGGVRDGHGQPGRQFVGWAPAQIIERSSESPEHVLRHIVSTIGLQIGQVLLDFRDIRRKIQRLRGLITKVTIRHDRTADNVIELDILVLLAIAVGLLEDLFLVAPEGLDDVVDIVLGRLDVGRHRGRRVDDEDGVGQGHRASIDDLAAEQHAAVHCP